MTRSARLLIRNNCTWLYVIVASNNNNNNNELYDADTPKDKLATSAKSLTIKIIMISYKFKLNVIGE